MSMIKETVSGCFLL